MRNSGHTPWVNRHWGFLILAGGLLASSCSLMLVGDGDQCLEDRDCARFTDAVCNRTTRLCVGKPIFTTDGSANDRPRSEGDGGVGG